MKEVKGIASKLKIRLVLHGSTKPTVFLDPAQLISSPHPA
jgi:hypothetical protein